jgi:amphiphysin
MQNLMKAIRKTIQKREHKLVDYDRHRLALKKLQDKKDRSLSDEKQIFKVHIKQPPFPSVCHLVPFAY